MSNRELTTFPFPPTLKNKLLKAGFRYVNDLGDIKIADLAKGAYFDNSKQITSYSFNAN